MKVYKDWTKEEVELLLSYIKIYSQTEIAKLLDRHKNDVKYRIRKLNIRHSAEETKDKKSAAMKMCMIHNNLWSEKELEYLVNNYSNNLSKDLKKVLNRSIVSINAKAHELGLKKSKEIWDIIYKEVIPNSDGYKKMLRPSQTLSRGYVLRNVLKIENTPVNRAIHGSDIIYFRNKVLEKRKNKLNKLNNEASI